MAEDKKAMTSEEKLLNLIRKKTPEKKAEGGSKPAPDLFGLERRSKAWQRDFFKIFQVGSRILMAFCLVLAVYIVMNLVFYAKDKKPLVTEIILENDENFSGQEAFTPQMKGFNEYDELSKKNVFALEGKTGPGADPAAPEEAVTSVVDDFTQSYKLVGIILDQYPQAVIEDAKNDRTLFLSKGEEIGGAILEKIEEGRVIFLRNGQRVELIP